MCGNTRYHAIKMTTWLMKSLCSTYRRPYITWQFIKLLLVCVCVCVCVGGRLNFKQLLCTFTHRTRIYLLQRGLRLWADTVKLREIPDSCPKPRDWAKISGLPTPAGTVCITFMNSPIRWVPSVLSPGTEWPGREADHSHPSWAEIKNAWSYTSTSPISLDGVVFS
jgi:hypothetical protein